MLTTISRANDGLNACERALTGGPVELSTELSTNSYDPLTFVQQKAERSLKTLLAMPVEELAHSQKISLERSTAKAFSKWLYAKGVVSVSEFSLLMSDKLFAAKFLQETLGDRFKNYHPPAMGLKEFFVKYDFVNESGEVRATHKQILKALRKEFPKGFVVKPTTGMSSAGNGFIASEEKFLEQIVEAKRGLSAEDLAQPQESMIDPGKVLSGERWFIMGKIGTPSFLNGGAMASKRTEFRVHTLWSDIVPVGTLNRFYLIFDDEKGKAAENMIADLLRSLPPQVTQHQAWSFDVLVDENNFAQMAELNSNRGLPGTWSGFFSMPEVLAAYSQFLAKKYNWSFENEKAMALRLGFGSLKPFFVGELERWEPDSYKSDEHRVVVLTELQEFHYQYIQPLQSIPREHQSSAVFIQAVEIGAQVQQMIDVLNSGDAGAWDKFRAWAKAWIDD